VAAIIALLNYNNNYHKGGNAKPLGC